MQVAQLKDSKNKNVASMYPEYGDAANLLI